MISRGHQKIVSKIVTVNLANDSYDIHIGYGLLQILDHYLSDLLHQRVTIITESNVAELHLTRLTEPLDQVGIKWEVIILEPGEKSKSLTVVHEVVEKLLSLQIERKDLLIAFGGGVIGDLAGFVASIVLRGIEYVQIPTTLLAQVDSAIGGKTGINSKQGKNLIGSFKQPKLVLNDLELITTLPARQYWAGYGEVLKYGLICDRDFFDWLETNSNQIKEMEIETIMKMVQKSCQIKSTIVEEDEKELGNQRTLLNLGHTFGHAFETLTDYTNCLLHGEAVTIGCNLAFQLSAESKFCPKEDVERLTDHMRSFQLVHSPNQIKYNLPTAQMLMKAMKKDKKVMNGVLRFVLVRGIGEAFVAENVNLGLVEKILQSNLPHQ